MTREKGVPLVLRDRRGRDILDREGLWRKEDLERCPDARWKQLRGYTRAERESVSLGGEIYWGTDVPADSPSPMNDEG